MNFMTIVFLATVPNASDATQQQTVIPVQVLPTQVVPAPEMVPARAIVVQEAPEYVLFAGVSMRMLNWNHGGLLDRVWTANFKGGIQGPYGFYGGLDASSGGLTGEFASFDLKNPVYVDVGFFAGWSPMDVALLPLVPYIEVGVGGQFFILNSQCDNNGTPSASCPDGRNTVSFATVRGTAGLQVRVLPIGAGHSGLYLDVSGTAGTTLNTGNDAFFSGDQAMYWGINGAVVFKI